MRNSLAIGFSLALFWLLNSGHFTALLLGFGVLSVVLVSWISHRMDMVDHESQPLQLLRKIPTYWAWLAWQILLSNIDVARRVWHPGNVIDPTVETLPLALTSDITRVVYANSINLTPGTLVIDLKDDSVLVHGLTREAIVALQSGTMERRVASLESV